MPDRTILQQKTDLLLAGTIVLDRKLKLPFPLSRSSAGPEVGSLTLILGFANTRVKLRVTRNDGDSLYKLVESTNDQAYVKTTYTIMRGLEVFLQDVTPIWTPIHAPGQAFINIDANCHYHCLFCSSPELENYRRISNERWVRHIRKFAESGDVHSIAITSGIPTTIPENIEDFVCILTSVRDLGLAMGVEPYVDEKDQLQSLYDAGARELKLNIQSWDRTIFDTICPELDRDTILDMLGHGVEIFGRNNVCSNLIIGLGESDESVIEGVEDLARMGVAVNLRKLHLNRQNEARLRRSLTIEPVTSERFLGLRKVQKEIFSRHGIDTNRFRTMCFPCGACDLDL